MSNEIEVKDRMNTAANGQPQDASECGMEQAHDLGLLPGPNGSDRYVTASERPAHARTDFPHNP